MDKGVIKHSKVQPQSLCCAMLPQAGGPPCSAADWCDRTPSLALTFLPPVPYAPSTHSTSGITLCLHDTMQQMETTVAKEAVHTQCSSSNNSSSSTMQIMENFPLFVLRGLCGRDLAGVVWHHQKSKLLEAPSTLDATREATQTNGVGFHLCV